MCWKEKIDLWLHFIFTTLSFNSSLFSHDHFLNELCITVTNTQHEAWLTDPYPQGPKGENVGSITQPLPSNYLIFRAASESDGEVAVHMFNIYTFNDLLLRSEYTEGASSRLSEICLFSRPVLDGRPGVGSQLFQSLQADSQNWERRRYQHVFRVPYTPPATVYCTHWYGAAAVSSNQSIHDNDW